MEKITSFEERMSWIKKEILTKQHGEEWLFKDIKRNWNDYGLDKNLETTSIKKYSTQSATSIFENKKDWIESHFRTLTIDIHNEHEFRKLKSRWSTHKKRTSEKTTSISLSLDKSTHKKLKQLKGKHNLNKTITAIIDSAYQAQTTQKLIPLKKITTPVLDLLKTGPDIFNESIEITEGIYKINLETINDIHRKTIIHAEKLAELIYELSAINNKLITRFKLN